MQRVPLLQFAVTLGASWLLAIPASSVVAEEQPGYWAGNVSLAQPASLPEIDDAAEAAPLPPPVSAPIVSRAAMPTRRVRQVAFIEPVTAPVTNQARQALDFYGGYTARATLNQMPRRSAIRPATTGQMQHNGKPFQNATTGTTVSPYLNLFRDDDRDTDASPSYYAFVRPQLDQQEAAQRQQRELDRMQRQGQAVPAASGGQYQSTGGPARYMDTAQFYGGWRR
jgi:hypothetical protein